MRTAAIGLLIVLGCWNVALADDNSKRDGDKDEQKDKKQLLKRRAGKFALVESRCYSPADAMLAASYDIEEVPQEQQAFTRYLWEHNEAKYINDVGYPTLSYHINALSREPDLIPPAVVIGAAGTLFRINLLDYGIESNTFARLADDDFIFHVRSQVPVAKQEVKTKPKVSLPGLGKSKVKSSDEIVKSVARVDHAPWLVPDDRHKNALARLATLTHSRCPIVSAQWFFFRTAIQDGRNENKTGYYDFLKLGKKESDFLSIGGGDVVKAKALALKLEMGAVIVDSHKVAINNRQIRRVNMLNGSLWFTLDVNSSVGKKNAVRHLDQLKPDGSEQILTLPNGLPAFWLQDGKGDRVDFVPPDIANNTIATGKDTRVHSNLTCVRCHHILHPIDDHIRKTFSSVVKLNVRGTEQQRRIRQLYFGNLQEQFDTDIANYAKKVKQVSGLEMGVFVKAYGAHWDDWVEKLWGVSRIARLAGMSETELIDQLKEQGKNDKLDLVLAGLLNDPPVPIRYDQLEEVFPIIMLTRKP